MLLLAEPNLFQEQTAKGCYAVSCNFLNPASIELWLFRFDVDSIPTFQHPQLPQVFLVALLQRCFVQFILRRTKRRRGGRKNSLVSLSEWMPAA